MINKIQTDGSGLNLGGFPMRPVHLKKMQDAGIEASNSLFGAVPANTPVVISGMAQTGNAISAGYFYYNGEIIRTAGGTATLSGSLVLGLNLVDTPYTETFEDNSNKDVFVSTVGVVTGGVAGVSFLAFSAFVPLCKYLMGDWIPVAYNYPGIGLSSATWYYRKNALKGVFEVYGNFSFNGSGNSNAIGVNIIAFMPTVILTDTVSTGTITPGMVDVSTGQYTETCTLKIRNTVSGGVQGIRINLFFGNGFSGVSPFVASFYGQAPLI